MKAGDRVRVLVSGRYNSKTGIIVGDDGEKDLNLWVRFDGHEEGDETPFGEKELRKIDG